MMVRATVACVLAAISAIVGTVACSPASPSCFDQFGRGQTTLNHLDLSCANAGATMRCQATASVEGLYAYCPMPQDVTAAASWSVGDPTIVKSDGEGVFESGRPGDTTYTAKWQNLTTFDHPVSVFAGTPPYPTFVISGRISSASGALIGGTVTILDGVVAGRSVRVGQQLPFPPGYIDVPVFDGYALYPVPPGTYTLRATSDGFTPMTKTATVTYLTGPRVDFVLVPSTSQ
jgi:hypothetical protein